MSELTELNWWSVIVATIIYFVLGAIWYRAFAKQWMELREISEEDIGDPNPVIFLWSFILQFIAVFTLAIFMNAMDVITLSKGTLAGFGAGAGFVFTLAGTTGLFSDNKLGLHFIDNGYHVVGLTIAGAILGFW